MNPTSTTPAPTAVDEARNLLAGVLDADLDLEPLLTTCDAYNHLEQAHGRLWSPPSSTVPNRVSLDPTTVTMALTDALTAAEPSVCGPCNQTGAPGGLLRPARISITQDVYLGRRLASRRAAEALEHVFPDSEEQKDG
jgi:hypothetical protein